MTFKDIPPSSFDLTEHDVKFAGDNIAQQELLDLLWGPLYGVQISDGIIIQFVDPN